MSAKLLLTFIHSQPDKLVDVSIVPIESSPVNVKEDENESEIVSMITYLTEVTPEPRKLKIVNLLVKRCIRCF